MSDPAATFSIRPTAAADFDAIQRIYAHHVLHGLASFEEAPPDSAELTQRWRAIAEAGLPYLCAADADGALVGYAYAGPYRPRSAYRFTVEDSVYVAQAYGRPAQGVHVLQLEINRALYMNETTLEPTAGFAAVQDVLKLLIERLSSAALALVKAA